MIPKLTHYFHLWNDPPFLYDFHCFGDSGTCRGTCILRKKWNDDDLIVIGAMHAFQHFIHGWILIAHCHFYGHILSLKAIGNQFDKTLRVCHQWRHTAALLPQFFVNLRGFWCAKGYDDSIHQYFSSQPRNVDDTWVI